MSAAARPPEGGASSLGEVVARRPEGSAVRLLISVRSVAEAMLALEAGADLIDLKEPDAGALGAVAFDVAADAVRAIAGRRHTSATIGDLPARVDVLTEAVSRMAASGVDFVKIGLMPDASSDIDAVLRGLTPVARKHSIIAVLFADCMPAGDPVAAAAEAGLAGVMIDTADKSAGSLRDCRSDAELARFVRSVHQAGMLAGLAGSLRATDIAPLAALRPDYLGFRGAACARHLRGCALEAGRIEELRGVLGEAADARLRSQSANRLAALGATMPEMEEIPRRRERAQQ